MSVYKDRNVIHNPVSAKRWMLSSALTAVSMAAMAVPTQAADPAHSWLLNQDAGSFTTSVETGHVTNIKLNTDRAIGSGDATIYAGHTVNVDGALLAVRDTKSDPTRILGNLNSNGKIIIIDGNGVFFGKDSHVDVLGIVATTGNIDNNQILNNDFGNYVIDNADSGSIELNGTVNVAEAGLAAFVSPFVVNNGVINAKLGNVVMASGKKVTLDLYGDGLLELAVDGELADALIKNEGTINAEGGKVQVTALAAKEAVDNIINMDGIVNVASVTQKGGKIILSGGDKGKVEVSGTLAASGKTDGGSVNVTGQNVDVTKDAVVVADAGENGNGGTAYFYGDEYTIFSGKLLARGGSLSGNGGNAEISAGNSVGYYGYTDLSAANGDIGTLLIDPEHLTISDAAFSMDWKAFWSAGLNGNININDQALADTLHFTNVNLWATKTLSTGSDIDISQYNHYKYEQTGSKQYCVWGSCFSIPQYGWVNHPGITSNTLTIAAPEVNLVHDITLGNGVLNVADLTTSDSVLGFGIVNPPHDIVVDHLNLDGRVYKRSSLADASFTTLADDAQINTTANTVNVLSNDASIQQAIQFVDASDADAETVNVAADTYTENLDIDRSVKLDGASGATLQAASAGNLITVTASDVNIDPFVFDGLGIAANGIYADDADNLVVDGNTFQGFTDNNIAVENSASVRIRNNSMTGAQKGVYANNTADIWVYSNEINGASVAGVHLSNTDGTNYYNDADIWHNRINSVAGATGILVENSNYATVGAHLTHQPNADDSLNGNVITGGDRGIVISDSENAMVRYNDVSNTTGGYHHDGITVTGDSVDVQVLDNTVTNSGWDGIYAGDSAGTQVIGNSVSGSAQSGITIMEESTGTLVENNTVFDSQRGILVKNGASDTTIRDNVVYNQTLDGIRAQGDGSLEVTGNYVGYTDKAGTAGSSDNIADYGIFVVNGNKAQIKDNRVINVGKDGVVVKNSSHSVVQHNTVTNAGNTGVVADNASGIHVRDNTIVDAGVTGVHVMNSSGTNSIDDVDVWGNTISSSNDATTGVLVENSAYATVGVTENNPFASGYAGGNKISGGGDGVVIKDSDHAVVRYNTISDVNDSGITVRDSEHVLVSRNKVNAHVTGIKAFSSDALEIDHNDVTGTSGPDGSVLGDGVFVQNSKYMNVHNNTIHDVGDDGVQGNNTDFADVHDNTITNVVDEGVVLLGGSNDSKVRSNTITGGQTGVRVISSNNVEVTGNTISDQVGKPGHGAGTGDGINIDNSDNAVVNGNAISGQTLNGIEFESGSDNAVASNNVITNVGDAGIVVRNGDNALIDSNDVDVAKSGVRVTSSNNSTVSNNKVDDASYAGISSSNSNSTQIVGNEINRNGASTYTRYGILVDGGNGVDVNGNEVEKTIVAGIAARKTSGVDIKNNLVEDGKGDGILVKGGYGAYIYDNAVNNHGDDGIDVRNNNGVEVKLNTVSITGLDSYDGDGIQVHNSQNANIANNYVRYAGDDGIDVENSYKVRIQHNDVYRSGDDGIDVEDSYNANIYGNAVNKPHNDGIELSRSAYADVTGNNIYQSGDDGIDVDASYRVDVIGNNVANTLNGNGIEITNSYRADVIGNNVHATGQDGIYLAKSSRANIHGNNVSNAGDDGIDVDNSKRVNITVNHVSSSKHDGIEVENGYRTFVAQNHVEWSGDNGVNVKNSDNTRITRNTVRYSGDNGVKTDGGRNVMVNRNVVYKNEGNGIFVSNNKGKVFVKSNTVLGNHRDGVYVNNVPHAEISGNTVSGNWDDGIHASNISSPSTLIVSSNVTSNNGGDGINAFYVNSAYITNNRSFNNGDDGIDIDSAKRVKISGNAVYGNGYGSLGKDFVSHKKYHQGNGIEVSSMYGDYTALMISGNSVYNNAMDGINVNSVDNVKITGNNIFRNGDDGIDVNSARHVEITGNNIYRNGYRYWNPMRTYKTKGSYYGYGNGIEVSNVVYGDHTLIVDGNNIHNNAMDGVNVDNARHVEITDNNIFRNGDDGIDINWASHVEISGNDVYGNGYGYWYPMHGYGTKYSYYGYDNGNGIEVSGIYSKDTLIISDNNIFANRSNGIEISNSDSSYILDNNIYENGSHGLAVLGWGNGKVVVAGNEFTDNPIGALFESGYIDLSDLINPNSFTNTDPSETPVGIVFDGADEKASVGYKGLRKLIVKKNQLSLVGNTLGTTSFTGFQNDGSFYVRIEDGTFLDKSGAPIVIDGLNATFDGIVPSLTGGILEATVLNYIEDRLYDADDSPVNGRGQIFVGETPRVLNNIEDFFNKFFGVNPRSGRLNVTIAGLPSVGALRNGAPNGAAALNMITPAAGGDQEEQSTGNEVANIEPAAGGEKVSCWNDAISAASNGTVVNYSFGTSFSEILEDVSSCNVAGL